MENLIIQLVVRLGIPAAIILLENIKGAKTAEDAIAALSKTMSAQEYVDADAATRGIPARPLPKT